MSALGKLVVELSLNYAAYTQGLDKSDQAALKFAQNSQRSFDRASRATTDFLTGMAARATIALGTLLTIDSAVTKLTTSINTLAQIDDAAQRTGASVENLSRIQQSAASFGHSFEPLEEGIAKLAKGMAAADTETSKTHKGLRALGISATDAAGHLRDPAEVAIEVAKKLQLYADGAEKTAVANDIFSKSGDRLLPVLNDVAGSIDRFNGYSTEAAEKASELQDGLNGISGQVDQAFTAFAVDLLPTLQKVTNAWSDTTEGTSLFSDAAKIAKSMINQLVILGAAAGFVFTTLGKTVTTAGTQLMALAKLDFRGVRNAGTEWANDLMEDYKKYSEFHDKILAGNEEIIKSNAKRDKPERPRLVYSTGTDEETKRLESLNDAARKYIDTLKTETLSLGTTAIQTKMVAAAKQAAITPSQALRAEIMEQALAWSRLAQFQQEVVDEFAVLQEREDVFRETSASVEEYGRAVDLANESARFEIELLGKTAEEREFAIAQRRVEIDLRRQILAINEQVANEDDKQALIEKAQAIGARAEAGARLQAQARVTGEEWNRMWGTVEQTGKLAFVNLLGHGTSSMKAIGQSIKASIIDMLYQLTVRKWIIQVGASITGTALGGNALAGGASGGGGMGVGSMLQMGSSIYSALSGGLTAGLSSAVSGLGAAFGSSAVGAFGAGLGMSGSAAAAAAGAYGAAGMASTGTALTMGAAMAAVAGPLAVLAIADMGLKMLAGDKLLMKGGFWKTLSAIPILGIGANLLNAMFGTGPKKLGPAELTGNFSQAGFSGEFQADWTRKVGWFSGAAKRGRRGLGIDPADVVALNEMFSGITDSIQDFVEYTGTAARSLAGWKFDVRRQLDTDEKRAQLALDLSNSLAEKLAPELVAIQQKGEQLTATLGRARAEFALTSSIIDLTGQSFGAAGLASLGLRDNLVMLLGGLENAGAAMQPYFDAFYSDAERSAHGWRMINSEMTRLGIDSLPTTRDQFRALVESQDLATESGQEMFAALIALAPAFASLTEQAKQARESLTLLTTDSFSTLVDYTRYIRLAANAGVGPKPDEVFQAGGLAAATTGNNAALLEELRQIRAEQQAGDIAIAQSTALMASILSRWEGDGMPEIRDIAA